MADLVEQNNTLLRLGFHFECPDARRRVTAKLMENMDEGKNFIRQELISITPSPEVIKLFS